MQGTRSNTGFSVSIAFDCVVLGSVSYVGRAVVLGAVDFGGTEGHMLGEQFTLAVRRLARTDVAPSP